MLYTSQTDYASILSEFLQRQIIIFGPQVVHAKIAEINGLSCDKDGVVKKIEGEPQVVLQKVVDTLGELSDYAVKTVLDSVVSVREASNVSVEPDVASLNNTEDDILASMKLDSR